MNSSEHVITTVSGKKIDILKPDPKDISIGDISHALSRINRYNSQIKGFWSVAQHSLLLASKNSDPDVALIALLHDASEAFLGDVISPLKTLLPAYKGIESEFSRVIYQKYIPNVKLKNLGIVHEQDINLRKDEIRWFREGAKMSAKSYPFYLYNSSPETIELEFLKTFCSLKGI